MKEIALKIGENKQTITIYHDESTVHANEQPSQAWLLPNTSGFWSKSAGRMIHIFNSILETTSTGRMVIESNHIESKQDADVVIYPGAKGDKWWACNQLIKQVQTKAIPIFEKLHPSAQAVWIFDCSLAHESFGPSALQLQNMNFGPGGKKGHIWDTKIPDDDPLISSAIRGQVQKMNLLSDHPDPTLAGQPKGVQQILIKQGLWDHYNI